MTDFHGRNLTCHCSESAELATTIKHPHANDMQLALMLLPPSVLLCCCEMSQHLLQKRMTGHLHSNKYFINLS